MSHLETATLGIENGQAINVPTSGVEGSTDPREILKILLGRGWTPLTFPSEKAAVDAAGKASKAWDHKPQQESKGMNPQLQAIVQFLMQALTPNEAGAEIIPQTPGAAQMLQQGLKAPGQGGDVIRALQALPQKVNLTDQRGWSEKLSGVGNGDPRSGIGLFRPNMGSGGYNMYVGSPQVHQQQGWGLDEVLKTLAHESGHGVAQIAGVGGSKQPTGVGAIDMFANVPGSRLPKGQNEWLADALAGLLPKDQAGVDTQKQMEQVMQFLKSQQVLPQESQALATSQ